MIPLSDIATDALTEIANIGVGRAAASLSELTKRAVTIAVPCVELVDLDYLRNAGGVENQVTVRVSQGFTGEVSGCAIMALNRNGAMRLAELLLGYSEEDNAFDETEQAALLEIGNILINGIVGNLMNHLQEEVDYELPQIQLRGITSFVDLLSDVVEPKKQRVLLMKASLSIHEEMINGYVLLVFHDDELQTLFAKLEDLVQCT